ncbi:tRNA (adenosine(37)-N6)-threonylcarbamoyltransferase complex transferase subunit TsaD [Patescibacteria group bacterium]|nr:tRNA (adenosine(37)-N6)-threonylcarbamoyltransferase complex transferase subunit TsaD [Patescibacteria group bacterium]
MDILAIETSCDETAAAVVRDGTMVRSSCVASSTAMHEKYGGIVPEVAAREQLRCILPVIQEVLSFFHQCDNVTMKQCISNHIDAIAVTVGPGLIGSLLIGVEAAKTMAMITGKPVIPVNHVLAHMYANFVRDRQNGKSQITNHNDQTMKQCNNETIQFPAISLVVSGGHTELYLMKSEKSLRWLGGTLDDAAGECFDKTARLLGFGNRGGPAIQEAAEKCQIPNITYQSTLPRPMIGEDSVNFSFSGLKAAVVREVNSLKEKQQCNNITVKQLSSEIQEAITDVLVNKTMRAAQKYNAKSILISGGVAANLRLRDKFASAIQQCGNVPVEHRPALRILLYVPPISLCTDNAVYIASYAYFRGKPVPWNNITAKPDLSVEVR